MASNKKDKVDFSTALKAQATKLAPKKSGSSEKYMALVNGEATEFVRGGMSDEQWEKIKKLPPAEAKNLSTAVVTEGDGEAHILTPEQAAAERTKNEKIKRDSKLNQYKALIQNEAYSGGPPESGALVTPDELKMLRKMDPDTAAGFVEERVKKREYQAEEQAKQNPPSKLKDDPNAPPSSDMGVQKPDQGSPEEWKGPDSGFAPKGGTQTEMDNPMAAGPGMSPLANAMQMATGAAPKNIVTSSLGEVAGDAANAVAPMEGGFPGASNPAPVTGGFPGLAGGDQGVAQANAKGEQNGAQDLAALQSAADAVNPMNLARRFDNAITGALAPANKFVNNVIAPDQGAFPGAITNEQAATLPPSPNAGVVPGVPSPAMPPAPVDPGSGSVSASVKVPSGFTPVKDESMKGWDEQIAAAKKRQEDMADFVAGSDLVNQGLARKASEQRIETQKAMDIEAEFASKARLNAITEATRYQTAKTAAMEAAQKAAQTPTDPNRYWNNKDDGQKAAAIIAGALFGFTGQGMQWLQRIDGLIENDQRLQVADRAAKVQGLEAKARGMGEAADFAMKAGASEAEAHVLARQMKWEGLQSYLADITSKQTDLAKKMQGQMMLQQMAQEGMKFDLQGRELTSQTVARQNAVLADQATLAQNAATFKASLDAGGSKGSVMGPQAMELGGLAAAEKVALDLKAKFGEKNILSRIFDKGAAFFPKTNAKDYNIAREQAINMIAPMMGAGVLQKHDLDRWEGLMAKAGDVNGEEMLNILVQDIQRTYNEKLGALGAAGKNVSGFRQLGGPSAGSVSFTPSGR